MMKAWWHWVIVILGSLVAIVLLGAGALAYLVLRLDVRGEVERVVESATGRKLTIAGDVGVSYWPVLGLRAGNITLANVPGGRAPSFISADEIDIGVELQPLLNRQIVVNNLVLKRPHIALEIDAAGKPNWTLAPAARPAPTQPTTTPSRPSQPTVDVARTALRSVAIINGEATYYDARHGSGWNVGDINTTTALTALNQPVQARGTLKFNDRIVNIDLRIGNPGAMTRAQPTPIALDVNGELINLHFDGQSTATAGVAEGNVHVSGSSLRQCAAWLGVPFQGGVGLEQFDISGTVSAGGAQFAFTNAGFAVDRVQGRGDFTLSSSHGKPYLSGRLQLFDFDLNPYFNGQGPPPPNQHITAPTPLPPDVLAAAPQVSTTPSASIAAVAPPPRPLDVHTAPSATPINLSNLQALNADVDLVTSAVLLQHMRIDASRVGLVLNDGHLAATVQSVNLYGGTGQGRFEIDASQPDALFSEDMSFDRVDAQRLLTDAVNFNNIEGTAELKLNLRTHGRSPGELIAHSIGQVHVEVITGVLHGVDMGGVSRTIRNALRGELIAPEAKTAFQGFSANFSVANGVLASDDLSFNTTDLRIPGVGVIDIPGQHLDLRVAPRSPHGGLVVPFSARGPWSQLTYDSDITGRALHAIQPHIQQVQAASRAH